MGYIEGGIYISLEESILVHIPEIISIYLFMNYILGNMVTKRKSIKIAIVYCLIFLVISNTMDMGDIKLLRILLMLLVFYLYTKPKLTHCIMAYSIVVGIKFLSELLILIIIKMMGLDFRILTENDMVRLLIFSMPTALLLVICFIGDRKNINISDKITNKNIDISKFIRNIIIVLSYGVIVLVSIGVFYVNKVIKVGQTNENILQIIIIVFCIVSLTCSIISIITINKNKQLKKIENNLITKNIQQMEETVNLLRTQKHDYMNHLQVILMQVSKGNNESARDYILSMSNNIGNNDVYYNTGNDYIDAALNIKKSRAIKYNIELTACVDSSLEDIELLESELNAIILNILDNSIEELKNSKKEYKYVHLDIYKEDKYHNISVKNNGRKIEDTNKIFEMGYSSKGNDRGYGLYAIKKLLKSYNCNIEVYSDEEETEFAIQVPIRAK